MTFVPTFNFRNTKTDKEESHFLFLSEMEQFLKDNPNLVQAPNTFAGIGDSIRMGMVKPDNGWRDLLKSIKKKNPGSDINTFD